MNDDLNDLLKVVEETRVELRPDLDAALLKKIVEIEREHLDDEPAAMSVIRVLVREQGKGGTGASAPKS